ncbi:phosphatidate cytidylyltransferase [Phaeobacter sp. B1627]|uniref:phosphatidate cytidylyltransferase n=1 Tax=Phaeobacter sp. B1627 TaxID=2583809 RepID=UPI00111A2829|nr:phosphatidate cytidylyltransferase [Phaeobacter sp. B1627]TNJ41640.1 phosphatidate cytidylyltransferase [Phaeobacter sp. B1627]
MTARGRWADLLPRTLSALVLLSAGAGALWCGGLIFTIFVAVLTGAVMWELVRLLDTSSGEVALNVGILSAAALVVATVSYIAMVPVMLLVPLALGLVRLRRQRVRFAILGLWVMIGAFGLIWLRNIQGLPWAMWLILVVVATDVAGYFVGKYIGGAKFWPAISPNKTWSGTAGGWAAAALIGLGFVVLGAMPASLILLSVGVSMASQLGDIVESAVKRRMGAKDASNLIPGHGGVFDRFDGMLGASALCFLVVVFWG